MCKLDFFRSKCIKTKESYECQWTYHKIRGKRFISIEELTLNQPEERDHELNTFKAKNHNEGGIFGKPRYLEFLWEATHNSADTIASEGPNIEIDEEEIAMGETKNRIRLP